MKTLFYKPKIHNNGWKYFDQSYRFDRFYGVMDYLGNGDIWYPVQKSITAFVGQSYPPLPTITSHIGVNIIVYEE